MIGGGLLTLAFPRPGLWWAGWFALAPLFFAVEGLPPGEAFRVGYAAGLAHFLSLFYWLVYTMQTYGGLPLYLAVPVLFLLCAYMALYVGAFCLLLRLWGRFGAGLFIAAPLFWVSMEYLRGVLFTGLPWCFLGYSQIDLPHVIQISDVFGVYGVSFLLAAANAAVYVGIRHFSNDGKRKDPESLRRTLAVAGAFAAMLVATLAYGQWRISDIREKSADAEKKTIAVVQGNIDQAIKWAPEYQEATTKKYIELSLSTRSEKPDLVVWPETAIPFYFLFDRHLTEMVGQGIVETGTDFLIGSPSFKRIGDAVYYYNSAYLIEPSPNVAAKYDKVHLVPFGEYVPLKRWLPFIGKMVAQVGDFKPGKKGDAMPWKDRRIGVQICYEIVFPDLARAMAKNGADLLVNITNDAWFAKTSGPYQHFDMAVFRAVENRRALVRAANTGISAFVDPAGNILEKSDLYVDAVLTKELPLIEEKSVYTRFGDFLPMACVGTSFVLILVAVSGFRPKWKSGK